MNSTWVSQPWRTFPLMGIATQASLAQLDKCDVYVGIFARRYGYVEPGYERSVTECEYDYAKRTRNIECLCFLLADDAPWPAERIQHDALGAWMREHRIQTEQNIIRWFRDPSDLKYEVFLRTARLAGADGATPARAAPPAPPADFVGRAQELDALEAPASAGRHLGAEASGELARLCLLWF